MDTEAGEWLSPTPNGRPDGARAAAEPVRTYRHPVDRRTRPQRWAEAVATLQALQNEYSNWRDALPEALEDSRTAELLDAVCDLELSELEIELPRGFGRD